jgi:hypothetical protein
MPVSLARYLYMLPYLPKMGAAVLEKLRKYGSLLHFKIWVSLILLIFPTKKLVNL